MPPGSIVVSGPGPSEPSQAGATDALVDASAEQNGNDSGSGSGAAPAASAGLMATSASLDAPPSNEGDDDDSVVSPAAADPYAGLDSAFGGYTADEPRPQTKDLLDMI